jgi:hypothetical protein
MSNLASEKNSGGWASGRRQRVFTDKVYAMIPLWVNQGLSCEDIAKRIGTSVASLRAVCARERIPLKPATLTETAWGAIETEARKLRVTPERLIALVMERVASDGLFKAVLNFSEPARR